MDKPEYEAQARGGLAAYERYLAGMDASMRQKVALTAAHLLCEGRVADMGMGSGGSSHALAALYPRLEVVGVDIDDTMVARARDHYRAPNLSFVAGDIAHTVFPPGTLDGIFDSSVLHHVTSYRGYRHENAAEALEAQVVELKDHGVLGGIRGIDDGVDRQGRDVALENDHSVHRALPAEYQGTATVECVFDVPALDSNGRSGPGWIYWVRIARSDARRR